MKWNRFVFSTAMLMCSMHMSAADSTYVAAVDSFKMVDSTKVVAVQESKYEKHLDRRARAWASLIPTHFVIQNAGNMGVISLGVGWSYGKNRKWETELLFGYIPRHDSSRGKLTTTLKGNYIPWRIDLNPSSQQQLHKYYLEVKQHSYFHHNIPLFLINALHSLPVNNVYNLLS